MKGLDSLVLQGFWQFSIAIGLRFLKVTAGRRDGRTRLPFRLSVASDLSGRDDCLGLIHAEQPRVRLGLC